MAGNFGKGGLRQRVELRGLGLPAIRTRGGYFASKSPHDVAWGDLMLAIFCPINGRFMNRTFGSGLDDVLFEPNIRELASTAELVIQDTAQKWVSHIVIDDIEISATRRNLFIKVSFHLTDDDLSVARLIELPRDDLVRSLGLQRTQ